MVYHLELSGKAKPGEEIGIQLRGLGYGEKKFALNLVFSGYQFWLKKLFYRYQGI